MVLSTKASGKTATCTEKGRLLTQMVMSKGSAWLLVRHEYGSMSTKASGKTEKGTEKGRTLTQMVMSTKAIFSDRIQCLCLKDKKKDFIYYLIVSYITLCITPNTHNTQKHIVKHQRLRREVKALFKEAYV